MTQDSAPKEETSKEETGREQPVTEEDIKNMTYWELWTLRRKTGMWYHVFSIAIYSFLVYLFLKVCYLFYARNFAGFHVDLWSIPLCIVLGLIYWYAHELIYKKKHLPQGEDKK